MSCTLSSKVRIRLTCVITLLVSLILFVFWLLGNSAGPRTHRQHLIYIYIYIYIYISLPPPRQKRQGGDSCVRLFRRPNRPDYAGEKTSAPKTIFWPKSEDSSEKASEHRVVTNLTKYTRSIRVLSCTTKFERLPT